MKGLLQPDQIGIHAVSEGRWIALMVATRDPSIKLIVMNARARTESIDELRESGSRFIV